MEDPQGLKIHALLTVIPLWILGYAGMKKVYGVYKLKEQKTSKEANTNA